MAEYKSSGMDAEARDDIGLNGVPLLFFSGQNDDDDDDGAKLHYADAHTAAPTKNGTPSIFSGERAATLTNGGAEHLHTDAHSGSPIKTGALYISSDVEPAAAYCNSDTVAGEHLPLASQVSGDKTASVPGAFAERLRRGLPVLGLSVASLAVAGLAAGEPTPAVGFGLFLMLIAGLSAVTIRVLRA